MLSSFTTGHLLINVFIFFLTVLTLISALDIAGSPEKITTFDNSNSNSNSNNNNNNK